MHQHPLQLVLVIPVYNEAACIEPVLRSWHDSLSEQLGEGSFVILTINDGSRDATPGILDGLALPGLRVRHQPNGGHGNAVWNGYREALALQPDYIFQTDSDDQFLPEDFALLWERRQHSPFILGFRKERHDGGSRRFISGIVQQVNRLFFGIAIPDSNIPYRLMKAAYLAELMPLLPPGLFAPNIFLSVLAGADGRDLMNIPVTHRKRHTGEVSIVKWGLLKACFRTWYELLRFRTGLRSRLRQLKAAQVPI